MRLLTVQGRDVPLKETSDFTDDAECSRTGGIPARTANGQKLSLYVGIIDILQSYQLRKKLEHTFKAVLTDGVRNSSAGSDR